jgi:hypothetical protein
MDGVTGSHAINAVPLLRGFLGIEGMIRKHRNTTESQVSLHRIT